MNTFRAQLSAAIEF